MDPRAGLDVVVNRKDPIIASARNWCESYNTKQHKLIEAVV